MNLKLLLIAVITTCIVTTTTQAKADTYRAGKFTVTILNEETRVYVGCDDQGQCIRLEDGTRWRNHGYRGITWSHGDYYYSISWPEHSNKGMYLTIVNKNKRIFREKLVKVQENVP